MDGETIERGLSQKMRTRMVIVHTEQTRTNGLVSWLHKQRTHTANRHRRHCLSDNTMRVCVWCVIACASHVDSTCPLMIIYPSDQTRRPFAPGRCVHPAGVAALLWLAPSLCELPGCASIPLDEGTDMNTYEFLLRHRARGAVHILKERERGNANSGTGKYLLGPV